MSLGTLDGYYAHTQQTADGGAKDASISAILVEVADALKRLVYPTMLEPGTASNHVVDAPWGSRLLYTPLRPVRAITSLYVRQDAKGDPSLFTSDYLKVAYTDYRLVIDLQPEGWSKAGAVEILNSSFWGVTQRRPYSRLGFETVNVPGAVLLNYTYGYTAVPPAVAAALYTATSLLYARRKLGLMPTSASLNGASYSLAAPTAYAAVHSPDVEALLYGFYDPIKLGGS